MTTTGHHTADVLTLPAADYLTALWLKDRQDTRGNSKVTVNIVRNADLNGAIALLPLPDTSPLTLIKYVIGQLFADPDDACTPDCESVTVLTDGTIQVVISFDASEFISDHLCGTDGCDGDADSGDSYDGYCADCADKLYGDND